MEKIVGIIKLSLVEVLDIDSNKEIKSDSSLFDDLNLDSTSVLELLMVLEDKIEGFTVEPEELSPEDFETVESLAFYVNNQISELA